MPAIFIAVLVASLAGSLHCAGMCGPFATLTTLRPHGGGAPSHLAGSLVAYNVARLTTYVVVGALAGGLAGALELGGSLMGAQRLGTSMAGGAMVLLGTVALLRLAGVRLPRPPGHSLARRLARGVAVRVRDRSPVRRALGIGAATVLMPCGWLYAFALVAAGTESALMGGAVMFVFWLGTVPALVVVGLGARFLGHRLAGYSRWFMPVALVSIGALTLGTRAKIVSDARPIDPLETTEAPCCKHR